MPMPEDLVEKALKAKIDAMSHEDLARQYRFAPGGDPMFSGSIGEYMIARFRKLGGMTPEMSKRIGWDD